MIPRRGVMFMEHKSLRFKLRMIFPKKERRYLRKLFLLILIKTAFEFLGVSLILPFINLLVNPGLLEKQIWYRALVSILPGSDRNTLILFLILLIIAVYVFKNLFAIYMAAVQNVFVTRNQLETSARLLGCYLHKPYTFHLQHNTAEIMRSIQTDVGNSYNLVKSLITLTSCILLSGLLIVYLLAIDLWLTLSIVVGLSVYTVVYFLLVRKKLKAAGQEIRRMHTSMIKTIQQGKGSIKEVKLLGREDYFVDAYRANADSYVRNYRRYTILSNVPKHLVEVLCVSGVLGLVAIKVAAKQDLTSMIGSLSAFAVAAIRLLPSANTINSTINTISFQIPSLNAICELVGGENRESSATPVLSEGEAHRDRRQADICVENVSFTYPGTDSPVLKDISFTVRARSSVGIVGVTGAGTTTLVDIILGLLEPQSGRILFGGADIRDDYAGWQNRIGYIPQNIYLADESICENVALGLKRDQIDEARVWKALEAAQLAEFVRSLKDEINTVVGEHGVRLSGGQRQRIGIARALYRDPDILFLDEATSSLDMETERAVMDSIHKLSGEKTCIIITHRLSTIENCDDIYEIANGHISSKCL